MSFTHEYGNTRVAALPAPTYYRTKVRSRSVLPVLGAQKLSRRLTLYMAWGFLLYTDR